MTVLAAALVIGLLASTFTDTIAQKQNQYLKSMLRITGKQSKNKCSLAILNENSLVWAYSHAEK